MARYWKAPVAREEPLDHRGGLPHRLDALRGRLADDPGRERRPGEGDALEQLDRQPERLAQLPHAVLAQLDERLEDLVAEGLLRVDPQLLEDVVLPLDPGHGLVHVGEDGALQQVLRPALPDEPAEHVPVERLGDGLALLLGVGHALERREELLARVDDLDRYAQVAEEAGDLLGFARPHEAVLDEDRLQALAQGAVAQHGDRGRIDAAGEGVDGPARPRRRS